MQHKILTVTIPTWNRAAMLEDLLSELIQQIVSDNLMSKVEILVSNNGSEDDTEKIVLALKSKYDFIVYNNNGTNKGARYNVLKCMELAGGEYLILFGDDDRPNKGAIKRVIQFLENNRNTGSLYDSHLFKKNPFGNAKISLTHLIDNFYYYLGNAGLFIIKTDYIKSVLKNHPYEFFSPTWPQTQIFILASSQYPTDEIHIFDLDILTAGMHEQVMIYTSYYLWRTTYLDLILAIESIRNEIEPQTYNAAKSYFKKNVSQLFFNILQCGVFLDDRNTRRKTSALIFPYINRFSFKEKVFLLIAAVTLQLPAFISRTFSDIFIFLTRGIKGILKKNLFVENEREKRMKMGKTATKSIREFDFKNV